MGSQNQAAATFGAGIFLAFSLVGLMSTSFINQAVSLALGTFLPLWAETILAIVFAFVLITSAFLIGSRAGMGSIVGGVLGTLASILGAINSLFLLSLTLGIQNTGYSLTPYLLSNSQIVLAEELLFLMTIAVLLVGMPLVLVGSFQHLRDRSEESA